MEIEPLGIRPPETQLPAKWIYFFFFLCGRKLERFEADFIQFPDGTYACWEKVQEK